MRRLFSPKFLWVSSWTILFVLFFLMNYFTPYVADDFGTLMHYKFGTKEAITSFLDALDSVRLFYLNWGGRLGCHLLTVGASFLSPVVFDLVNTGAYLGMTWLLYRLCNPSQKHRLTLFWGIHILLWLCVPDYGQVMFWLCGSANYLWPSIPVLMLLLVYRKYAMSRGESYARTHWTILLFALGFLAGNAMDNMSAGMMVILTLYLFYFRSMKISIRPCIWSSYAGSLAGFFALVLAPGNFKRSMAEEGVSRVFIFFVINYYWVVFAGVLCIIWLAFVVAAKHFLSDTERRLAGRHSLLYVMGGVAAAYCMLVASASPERAWFIVCVYLIAAIGICYQAIAESAVFPKPIVKSVNVVVIGFVLICFTGMLDTVLYSREIKVQMVSREVYILREKERGNMEIRVPIVSHKYPFRAKHDALTGLSDIREDPDYWINQTVAEYYGVRSVTGYSQEGGL